MWLENRIRAAYSLLLDGRYHVPILVLLSVLPYCRTIDAPFYFDDFPYVVYNPLIRDLGNYFADIPRPANILEDTYNNFKLRPLSYLSFSLNYLVHGYEPAGYHLVNMAIHAVNVILVYLLVTVLFPAAGRKSGSAADPDDSGTVAFFTASLFAVHPVMTNAVTYVTQRMSSLVTLFYLCAVVMYARYLTGTSGSRPAILPYLISLACCCAAMLTKESAMTLPIAIVLIDLAFSRSTARQRLTRLAPFIASMGIIPFFAMGLEHSETLQSSNKILSSINLVNFTGISHVDYFLTQTKVIVFYLRLMVMPMGLSLEHQFPLSHSLVEPGVIAALLFHLLLIGSAARLVARYGRHPSPSDIRRYLAGCGIIWFYLTLSVTSSFIPITEPAVEYRLYLPATGLLLSFVCMLREACRRCRNRHAAPLTVGVLTTVVVVFAGLTLARNEVWRDPEAFWKQTIEQYPFLGRPYANLADHYLRLKRPEDAVATYRQAIDRLPNLAILQYELGNSYIAAGRYEDAVRKLNEAILLDPGRIEAYYSLARAKCYLGQGDEARQIFIQAEAARRGNPGERPPCFTGETGSGQEMTESLHSTASLPFNGNSNN